MPPPFEQEQKSIVQDTISLSAIAVGLLWLGVLMVFEMMAGAQVPILIILSSILGTAAVGGNLIHLAVRQINLETR